MMAIGRHRKDADRMRAVTPSAGLKPFFPDQAQAGFLLYRDFYGGHSAYSVCWFVRDGMPCGKRGLRAAICGLFVLGLPFLNWLPERE